MRLLHTHLTHTEHFVIHVPPFILCNTISLKAILKSYHLDKQLFAKSFNSNNRVSDSSNNHSANRSSWFGLCAGWQDVRDHCAAATARPSLHSTWRWAKKHNVGLSLTHFQPCLKLISPWPRPWPVLPVSPRTTVMAHNILLSIAEPPAESSIPTRVVLHLWIVPLDFFFVPQKQSEQK